MSDTLRVELLGRLRVVRGGEVTTRFETRQTAALLAILALSLPRACSRDSLLEHLWPDEDPEATRPRLRQSLSVLRGILNAPEAPPALVTDREEVRLDPSRVTTDLAEFQAAVEAARRSAAPADKRTHLEAALRLAQGELLPGASEDVILAARDRQAESHRGALVSLADLLRETGDWAAAIEAGQQAVAADPCDEQAHFALIRAYSAAGQTVKALHHARKMEQVLREELDAAPSDATRAFVESLRAPAAPAVPPPPRPPRPLSGPVEDAPAQAGAGRPPRKGAWALGLIAGCLLLGAVATALWPRPQGQRPSRDAKSAAASDYTLDDFLLGQRTKSGFEQAIKRDDAALKADPHDAAASVSEAEAYALMGYYGYIRSGEAAKRAEAGADAALNETSASSVTKAGALSLSGVGWRWTTGATGKRPCPTSAGPGSPTRTTPPPTSGSPWC